jgi:hypothetical protein
VKGDDASLRLFCLLCRRLVVKTRHAINNAVGILFDIGRFFAADEAHRVQGGRADDLFRGLRLSRIDLPPLTTCRVCAPVAFCDLRTWNESASGDRYSNDIIRAEPTPSMRRSVSVKSFFVFPPRGFLCLSRAASVAILPSALFLGAIVSLGASWASSIQQVLLRIDLGFHLFDGSRTRTWAQSPELGG